MEIGDSLWSPKLDKNIIRSIEKSIDFVKSGKDTQTNEKKHHIEDKKDAERVLDQIKEEAEILNEDKVQKIEKRFVLEKLDALWDALSDIENEMDELEIKLKNTDDKEALKALKEKLHEKKIEHLKILHAKFIDNIDFNEN